MSDAKPKCYTELRWEKDSVKCKGGPDPTFTDEDGGHVRPMCDLYQICAQRKMAALHSTAGLTNQTRSLPIMQAPQQQQIVPAAAQPTALAIQQLQAQQQAMQMRTVQASLPMTQVAPLGMGTPMQFTPIQFMSMNSFIPAYLSVPEPIGEDDTMFSYIGRSIFRSMLKATGHTLAHIFDNVPLKR